ncbi:MAG TPA: glycosyltransferase family 9 protein [Hanamia sp.]|nr:glycosyltransferase family 9 protein [Hanamia sp.]
MKKNPSHILISRTDSIGDVVLTLPVAKFLKDIFPKVKISFLGKNYTRPVIDACIYVDEFVNMDDFLNHTIYSESSLPDCIIHVFPVIEIAKRAKKLKIPLRIGTTNRLYHWATCNELIKLSRKNSDLHEAQLNLKLLAPFGMKQDVSCKEIEDSFGLEKIMPLEKEFADLLSRKKYNLILHPKSQGSGREWPLENFVSLIKSLDKECYSFFISGTEKERQALQPLFEQVPGLVTDIAGKMNLSQFIAFINQCNGLIASGTGPLHIASALGKDTFGIYPPIRPVHPARWKPLGKKARVFVLEKECNDCKNNPSACSCMKNVKSVWLKNALDEIAFT